MIDIVALVPLMLLVLWNRVSIFLLMQRISMLEKICDDGKDGNYDP
jgi:hypothetical protein